MGVSAGTQSKSVWNPFYICDIWGSVKWLLKFYSNSRTW